MKKNILKIANNTIVDILRYIFIPITVTYLTNSLELGIIITAISIIELENNDNKKINNYEIR